MRSFALAVLLLVSIFLVKAAEKNEEDEDTTPAPVIPTYTIFVPKTLKPGEGFKISVNIIKHGNPVTVDVTLASLNKEENVKLTASRNISEGETKVIETAPDHVIPISLVSLFEMTIVGKDAETGLEVFRNTTRDFDFKRKILSIFIQTDKAIYQPGQTIKFRAIIVDDELKPYPVDTATYTVKSPDDSTIVQERDKEVVKGVVGGEMKLIRQPKFGLYKITVIASNTEESVEVEVKEYTLPKFKVEVATGTFILDDQDKINGIVTATFTYGMAVKGSGMVIISHQRNNWDESTYMEKQIKFDELDEQGSYSFEISKDMVNKLINAEGLNEWDTKRTIEVTATITEKNTKQTYNGSTAFDWTRKKYKFEKLSTPETIKPGLTYEAYLKFTLYDGSLIDPTEMLKVTPFVEIYFNKGNHLLPYPSGTKDTETKELTIQSNGIAKIVYDAPLENLGSIHFAPKFTLTESNASESSTENYEWSWTAKKFKSSSDNFIQVMSEKTLLIPETSVNVTIKCTAYTESLSVMLIARGLLVLHDKVALETEADAAIHEAIYTFDVDNTMVPELTVLVVQQLTEEIISDSININVELLLRNNVTVTMSDKVVDAGTEIEVRVTATNGSYVGLLAVDQSVELLKKGNAITNDLVATDLSEYNNNENSYDPFRFWCWWPTSADSSEVFSNAGVIILTDAVLHDEPDIYYFLYDEPMYAMEDDMNFDAGVPDGAVAKDDSAKSTQTKIRTQFPETWIWADSVIFEDGELVKHFIVPDTITSWVVSAFALSDETGLGIASNEKITVFRKFFVSVTLPPSIIRGDNVTMSVTIYNYYDAEAEARLTLAPNAGLKINASLDQVVNIPSKDATTVKFHIEGNKVGIAHVIVTADTSGSDVIAVDSMNKTIKIKPEGIQFTSTNTTLVQVNQTHPSNFELEVKYPNNTVSDSHIVKLSIYGDIMGKTLDNLDKLIRVPSGCGEQNMLSYAPNVYIKMYLEESGKLTSELAERLKRNMAIGYQNQLKYQHKKDDVGSFSAFGDSDPKGSTWLTAYVLRVFSAAETFDNVAAKAMKFIISKQHEAGYFQEEGNVIHKNMQSNVAGSETMTAYCVISLMENIADTIFEQDASLKTLYDSSILSAKDYLEKSVGKVENIYAKIIVYYALVLMKSPLAPSVFEEIESAAQDDDGKKFWLEDSSQDLEHVEDCYGFVCKPSTTTIEMSAYMLLAYVRSDRSFGESIPIMQYLISKTNDNGGFSSTQDTVVGIQALSSIAGKFSESDLTVSITDQIGNTFTRTVTAENAIVMQTFVMPEDMGSLQVSIIGNGSVVVQLATSYNLLVAEENDDIKVEAKFKDDTLTACATLNGNYDSKTGMILMTIEPYIGFQTVFSDVMKANKKVRLVEMSDAGEISIYLNELIPGEKNCLDVNMHMTTEVGSQQPRMVSFQDYYNPGLKSSEPYAIPQLAKLNSTCRIMNSVCLGGGSSALDDGLTLIAMFLALLFI